MALLNLSLHLAVEATSQYAWIRTNVYFVLLMMVSYELERRDLQVPMHAHIYTAAHTCFWSWPILSLYRSPFRNLSLMRTLTVPTSISSPLFPAGVDSIRSSP